ncbi:MAG: FG-GAP repeat protein [Phycisphaerales bacterium]|nr:FG-GAP repeat protein [Phycisphaerales bacterium]
MKLHQSVVMGSLLSFLSAHAYGQGERYPAYQLMEQGDESVFFGSNLRIHNGRVVLKSFGFFPNPYITTVSIFDAQTGDAIDSIQFGGSGPSYNSARAIELDGNEMLLGFANLDTPDGGNSGQVQLVDLGTAGESVSFAPIVGPGESRAGELFGTAVALAGNRVVVSAPGDRDNGFLSGSVFVFDRDSQQQLRKIKPMDGNREDQFGDSMVVDSGVIAVGATHADNPPVFFSGVVYLFSLNTYEQLHRLSAPEPLYDAHYGQSLAMSGGYLAVGAPNEEVPVAALDHTRAVGAVYVYDVQSGDLVYKLQPLIEIENRAFGSSVAISGDLLVVGAPAENVGAGGAYVYRLSTGELLTRLTAEGLSDYDNFGLPVDIDGDLVVVGAAYADHEGENNGTVYVFDLGSCSVADLAEPYFELNFFDVSAFLSAYIAESDEADINGDGMFDFFDVSQFLTAYNGGCP